MSERATATGEIEPASVTTLIKQLPDLVNNDTELLRRGRFLTTDLMIEVGAEPYHLSIEHGRIVSFKHGPLIMKSWSFAIRGSEKAWLTFWRPIPPPNFHDIFALAKLGEFRIEGDFTPLITNLLYFKALFSAPRALHAKALATSGLG
jgi:hypothetical protein